MPAYNPKPLLIAGSLVLIAATAVLLWWPGKQHRGEERPNSNARISGLLENLDRSYWENPTGSLDSVNLLMELSNKTGNNQAVAMALYYKAACFVILERYDSAYFLCRQALAFAEEQNNDRVTGKMKIVLANYHIAKNEFDEAGKFLMEALVILENHGTNKDVANALNGLGLLYYDLKESDKAIGYYKKVLLRSKQPAEKRQESVALMNISNCYRLKQNFDSTLLYLNKALAGFRMLNDSAFIMMCQMNMGIVAVDRGEKEKGLGYYFRVMQFARRMDKKALLGHTLFNIASVYNSDNNTTSAKKYFLQSIQVYRSISNRDGEKNVLLELSKIEQQSNNWQTAFSYYTQYISIRDSVISAGLLKNIYDLQWKYDFQKKETEMLAIREKYELKQRETIILIISLSSFALVALLFVALIRLRNKNLKKADKLKQLQIAHLNEKIEAKNRELTTSSLQLITKNEILSTVSGIADTYLKKNGLSEECYARLMSTLKENLVQEKDWQHFKRLFEDVHKDFFTSIKHHYPEITESELRICAYLKINLQNKEIAKLLNVTPDSLKTIRSRIRKKLNLPKEAILEDYIRSI